MNPTISFHRNLLQVDYTTTTTTASPPPYQPQSPYPLSPFHNSLVLTVIILLSIICFISFVTLYVRHFSDSPNSSSESPRARAGLARARKRTGVKLEDVEKIPVVSYEGEMKIWNECSICLSEFEEKESVKVIPFCKHVFHPTCIDTWLASHVSCPICRSTELFLAVDDEGVEEKEEDRTVEEMQE